MTTAAERLRALMREKNLTQRRVSELAGVSIKTVEGWLASPNAASHRNMPERHLSAISAVLRITKKAASSRKKG